MHREWVAPPRHEASFRELLATYRHGHHAGFIVWSSAEGEMVGYVTLSNILRSPSRRSAALGYWGVAGYGGRGWLTRGVALGLDHAFGSMRLERIEAHVRPENAPSIALLLRLGFEYEGIARHYIRWGGAWRDCQRFSMIREAWRRRPRCASRGDEDEKSSVIATRPAQHNHRP